MMRPWLWLPAQFAHDISPIYLKMRGSLIGPRIFSYQPRTWRGLEFKNPIGIAGGVDKTGASVQGWWSLGAGFVEVGTVTPRPQAANPGQIIDRQVEQFALWNKMGFPNGGMAELKQTLKNIARPYATPLFVNIGKNRDTQNEDAVQDYAVLLNELHDVADVFVINISSPNTKGLRDLQSASALRTLLSQALSAQKQSPKRPVLVKLSPDLSEAELRETIDISSECGIDGWILTNTTLSRSAELKFPSEGGVSGKPLTEISRKALATAVNHLGNSKGDRIIVSVGGILSSDEMKQRLDMGADLLQVYSGLIFNGPGFIAKSVKQLQLAL
jgi:dihydroorotate dehydrogenase